MNKKIKILALISILIFCIWETAPTTPAGVPPGIGCYTHVDMLEWHIRKAIYQLDNNDPGGAYLTLSTAMRHH